MIGGLWELASRRRGGGVGWGMNEEVSLGKVRRFDPGRFAQSLRLPAGSLYVEGSTVEHARRALSAGYAVYAEGCDGRAFVWPSGDGAYEADVFYLGPAKPRRLETLEEAADLAASMCE